MARPPDPNSPEFHRDAYDHEAFYEYGTPYIGEYGYTDTGLRCWCGREVMYADDPDRWVHVGIGDLNDKPDVVPSHNDGPTAAG